jgi:hypothetical protein
MCYVFVQTRKRVIYIYLILLRSGNLLGGKLWVEGGAAGRALPSRQPTTTGWMDQSSLFIF